MKSHPAWHAEFAQLRLAMRSGPSAIRGQAAPAPVIPLRRASLLDRHFAQTEELPGPEVPVRRFG